MGIFSSDEFGYFEWQEEHQKVMKYKKVLKEIKEICETNVCKHCYSKFKVDDNYCKNRKDCDCYNILQKINEVEDDRT